jgi:hypothetical protein
MATQTIQMSPASPVWSPIDAAVVSLSAGGPPLAAIAAAIAIAVVAVAAPYLDHSASCFLVCK